MGKRRKVHLKLNEMSGIYTSDEGDTLKVHAVRWLPGRFTVKVTDGVTQVKWIVANKHDEHKPIRRCRFSNGLMTHYALLFLKERNDARENAEKKGS